MNDRMTAKDRGLLKGAIRRAFARSALRREVLDDAAVEHSDPARPRVKRWCRCNVCKRPEARSYCVIDHIVPVIPLDSSFEEMGVELTVNRTWCDKKNLQCICPECHTGKTKGENEARKAYKKGKNK